MKTLKALCGLALLPLVVPIVLVPLSLSRNPASRQLCRDFWPALARDWRTIQPTREVAAALFMAVILLILGVGAMAHFIRAEWWQGIFDVAVALFLATRD